MLEVKLAEKTEEGSMRLEPASGEHRLYRCVPSQQLYVRNTVGSHVDGDNERYYSTPTACNPCWSRGQTQQRFHWLLHSSYLRKPFAHHHQPTHPVIGLSVNLTRRLTPPSLLTYFTRHLFVPPFRLYLFWTTQILSGFLEHQDAFYIYLLVNPG